MHNPYTSSGGVLIGKVKDFGSIASKYFKERGINMKVGQDITPFISLTCIPIYLDSVDNFNGEIVHVKGTAILFLSYRFCLIPNDLPRDVIMAALDISSLVPQVQRQLPLIVQQRELESRGEKSCIYVVGCGKSGMAAMAAIRQSIYSDKITILASDFSEERVKTCKEINYPDICERVDARDAKATLAFIHKYSPSHLGADLVINVTNVTSVEGASIIAAREHGTVILFSMATQFDRAALSTDALGKDVKVMIGVGIADNQDIVTLDLLRKDKKLEKYFSSRV